MNNIADKYENNNKHMVTSPPTTASTTSNDTEVIEDPRAVKSTYLDLINSAKDEILLILSSPRAFAREEKIGVIQSLMRASVDRDVKVRILLPVLKEDEKKIRGALEEIKTLGIEVRTPVLQKDQISRITILIVDKKKSLIFEVKDEFSQSFIDATRSGVFSTSKPRVLSYVFIFDSLWDQSELYAQLQETNFKLEAAYEQLQEHDRMQKDFINMAAHELRTPTQSLLGLAELMEEQVEEAEKHKVEVTKAEIEMLIRNAKKLHRLSSDIIDVIRIESQSLSLNKTDFDLVVLVEGIVAEYFKSISDKKDVELIFEKNRGGERGNNADDGKYFTIMLYADKERIAQVITNLVDNAITFTAKGIVTVSLHRQLEECSNNSNNYSVIFSVKDSGKGIDLELAPRLFSKFGSKPEEGGIGLGLYISKSIIEAHGGRIWAENNNDGKGSTFTFSLPLGA
jgi:signal transduction histidine kinase